MLSFERQSASEPKEINCEQCGWVLYTETSYGDDRDIYYAAEGDKRRMGRLILLMIVNCQPFEIRFHHFKKDLVDDLNAQLTVGEAADALAHAIAEDTENEMGCSH
ncbi:MAG: hypothetical protein OXH70_17545 [Acidobacteria bacterium]|nr:hypothetical protein [Acidobacteriota bacterium]